MRLNTLTISRVTPWLVAVVALFASSAGAQTVTPGIGFDPTSETRQATQQPLTGGSVERAATERVRLGGYAFGDVGPLFDQRVDVKSGGLGQHWRAPSSRHVRAAS